MFSIFVDIRQFLYDIVTFLIVRLFHPPMREPTISSIAIAKNSLPYTKRL